MAKNIDYKRRLQNQRIIIIALAIIIFVMVVISSTAAWYITTRTDTADIVLGKPVMPYITSFDKELSSTNGIYKIYSQTQENITGNTTVYPGDQVTMDLGFQLGNDEVSSSDAYVRVKLTVLYQKINPDTGKLDSEDITKFNEAVGGGISLIKYNNSIASGNGWKWTLVDFNKGEKTADNKPKEADYWYVLANSNTNDARVVKDKENFKFVTGQIVLDEFNITNRYANCAFKLSYEVEAIQTANVKDPILEENLSPDNRTHPWYEEEDIYFDQEV